MGASKHRSVFPPAEQRGLKENFENYRSNLFTNCFFNDISDMRQLLDQYSLLVLDLGLQAERSARNKRSEVAFLGADWEGDADSFPIIGFIP